MFVHHEGSRSSERAYREEGQSGEEEDGKVRVAHLPSICKFCGKRAAIEIRGKGPHKGEYCSSCGHWLRWIPKKVATRRIGMSRVAATPPDPSLILRERTG